MGLEINPVRIGSAKGYQMVLGWFSSPIHRFLACLTYLAAIVLLTNCGPLTPSVNKNGRFGGAVSTGLPTQFSTFVTNAPPSGSAVVTLGPQEVADFQETGRAEVLLHQLPPVEIAAVFQVTLSESETHALHNRFQTDLFPKAGQEGRVWVLQVRNTVDPMTSQRVRNHLSAILLYYGANGSALVSGSNEESVTNDENQEKDVETE